MHVLFTRGGFLRGMKFTPDAERVSANFGTVHTGREFMPLDFSGGMKFTFNLRCYTKCILLFTSGGFSCCVKFTPNAKRVKGSLGPLLDFI